MPRFAPDLALRAFSGRVAVYGGWEPVFPVGLVVGFPGVSGGWRGLRGLNRCFLLSSYMYSHVEGIREMAFLTPQTPPNQKMGR